MTRFFKNIRGGLARVVLVVSAALAGCHSGGHPFGNLAPHVEITGSPVEGDSVNYVVDFHWNAWDDDGAISRSEYAVDIPASFTAEQIADPATPGIEWTSTTLTQARVRFSAVPPAAAGARPATPGTTDPGGAPHTFYVRVYDNENGHSAVADRSVNAFTVLPKTVITSPVVPPGGRGYVNACRTLRVAWRAIDPDGTPPDYPVVRTEYKLIRVARVVGITDAEYVVNVDPGPNFPWLPVPGDSAALALPVTPGAWVLALRSVDEAGGVESRFAFGRNALLVEASSAVFPGAPVLTVREPVLGQNVFPSDGSVVDYEIIAGRCLHFTLSADAQHYGGVVQGYRWCIDSSFDASDPEATGCSAWGPTTSLPELCFTTPGIHTISVAVTSNPGDCGGVGTTSGTIRLRVFSPTFDRDVLYVDDYFQPVDPLVPGATDSRMDERFLAALRNAGYANVRSYDAWGANDLEGAVRPITLSELTRYRLVFWSVRGFGGGSQNANSALLQASSCATNRVLREYVAAGGALWINGEMVFGALKDRGGNLGTCLGTTDYSLEKGLNFAAGSFVTDFLHITGGDFRVGKLNGPAHGLLRAHPTARALSEGLPLLEADSSMFAYPSLGGLPFYDAAFLPTFAEGGGLDTLYTAEVVGPASPVNGKPIAWRYADPNPTPRQGPVIITSFPLQRMKPGAASRVVDGVRLPGTGLQGLVEALAFWLRTHHTRTTLDPRGVNATGVHARYDARERGD